ncbi:MAG: efflux RND transporter periplasmic adaptor subunit [Candidatus Acidiferrales bacterium]
MKRLVYIVIVAVLAVGLVLWVRSGPGPQASPESAAKGPSAGKDGTPGKGSAAGPPAMPPANVQYTEAREYALRRSLTLPGSVQAQTASVVAATVPAIVVEFPAKEGRRVKRGDVLARQRSTTLELTLESQRSALKEAEARLALAESNLRRAKDLLEAGVISRQQYDDAQSENNAWIGRTDSLKADIARITDDVERTVIRAPFDGVVVAERTEVGQWLAIGGPVVELLKIDEVEIRVDVPERHYAALRMGAQATATFESLPQLTLRGRITAIIPQADPQARTFPVKVTVRNEQGRVGAGMLAQVSFEAGEVYPATIVPKDAVISQGQDKFLYRVNGDNTVEQVSVQTGAGAGAWIEVTGAVRPGDRVVTRGNERLMPGMGVSGTPLQYKVPS